ncbi:hypothetical protein P3X46_019535 [Hevea brasiliensis]|uniref:Uncharacterized protein n=1 Tax=Hevea brasiliensis TaxID=3981 RepID=A0ABQ9LMU4_HEVBR|nr:uncharacterized protein LOC110647030 [Hevea brasiliensis]KAJ9167948.1 hypothetical protein P3X46_019535 [Hevea brasiliensis]
MEAPESPYPNLSPKESLIKRYKPIWRILLISNLALGAYMFAKARKKNLNIEERKTAKKDVEESKAPEEDFLDSTTLSVPETPSPAPAVLKAKQPIPEDQQRELFKWILEEKRKVKPKDQQEKKRIDEEKAILKQFIRAKAIPSF